MRQCIFRAQGLHGIARREGQGRNIAPRNRSHCRIEREAGRIGIEGKNEGQWSARHGQFDDTDVADFDEAAGIGGRGGDQRRAVMRQIRRIVADPPGCPSSSL